MLVRILIALLLAPTLALALPVANAHHECPAAATIPFGTPYPGASLGPHNWGANVMGIGASEDIFQWPTGAAVGVWIETNGLEGLQTTEDHCGPSDLWLAGASAGLGRPYIRL